ncbi:MAG: hypothetical protein IJL80_16055, partial [Treponema sp.]|nr:hypothetical protein [Treponema sp.]
QAHKRTSAQAHKRTSAQAHKRTSAQAHKRTSDYMRRVLRVKYFSPKIRTFLHLFPLFAFPSCRRRLSGLPAEIDQL